MISFFSDPTGYKNAQSLILKGKIDSYCNKCHTIYANINLFIFKNGLMLFPYLFWIINSEYLLIENVNTQSNKNI